MNEHMQHSLPDHLKQYQGGDTYVPQHAADAMNEHLKDTLPPHLQQYAGAYVEQRVVQPGLAQINPGAGTGEPLQPPMQTVPVGQVYPGASPAPASPLPPDQYQGQPAAPSPESPDQSYAFITSPPKPPRQPLLSRLPGGGSLIGRIGVAAGAIVVVIIVIVILRGIFGGTSANATALISVAQDQQELIHLVTTANQQSLLSTNQNFSATLQLSVASSQGKLIAYLTAGNQKIKAQQLNLKVSADTDNQLAAAATAGTYNQTFQQIMQGQLNTYATDLQKAYKLDKGKNGRAILLDSYQQVQLLAVQLATPSN